MTSTLEIHFSPWTWTLRSQGAPYCHGHHYQFTDNNPDSHLSVLVHPSLLSVQYASQSGATLLPWRHLTMSGDTLGVTTGRDATGIWMLSLFQGTGQPPHKERPGPKCPQCHG